MEDKIYLFCSGGMIEAPKEWYTSLDETVFTDVYEEVFTKGKYIIPTEEQIQFYIDHFSENLTPDRLFYMNAKSVEELNEEIRIAREIAYKAKSDPLYMAYLKYKAFGDEEKATVALDIWKQAVKEIEEEHPYITE